MNPLRFFIYGMVIPGILGFAALAAIVLPDGDDLSLTRLLAGGGAMIFICCVGGFIGGRAAARQ